MTGQIYMGGGFGGESLERLGASESLRHRIAVADAEYQRQAARDEREMRQLRENAENDRIQLSIRMAQERGEVVDVQKAYRQGGVGRTHQEIIAHASAVQDYEDVRQRAEMERQGVATQDVSIDTSAPQPVSAETAARNAEMDAGIQAARSARNLRSLARADAQTEARKAADRMGSTVIGAMAGIVGQVGGFQ